MNLQQIGALSSLNRQSLMMKSLNINKGKIGKRLKNETILFLLFIGNRGLLKLGRVVLNPKLGMQTLAFLIIEHCKNTLLDHMYTTCRRQEPLVDL